MWLLATLLNYIESAGFVPPDVAMFERLCSSITGAQVQTTNMLQRIQAFSVLNRKRNYLFHAPPSLGDEAKRELMISPVFSRSLFDEDKVLATISRHQGDVSANANQQLVKTVTSVLPSQLSTGKKRKLIPQWVQGWLQPVHPSPTLGHLPWPLWLPLLGDVVPTTGEEVGGGRGSVSGGRGRGAGRGPENFKENFQN